MKINPELCRSRSRQIGLRSVSPGKTICAARRQLEGPVRPRRRELSNPCPNRPDRCMVRLPAALTECLAGLARKAGGRMKDVVVIGAGKIGATVAQLLASTADYQVTLADRSPEILASRDRDERIRAVAADIEDSS